MTKSKTPGSREPGNAIDWDGIAAAYNEGTLTLKELGVEIECSAGAISRRTSEYINRRMPNYRFRQCVFRSGNFEADGFDER